MNNPNYSNVRVPPWFNSFEELLQNKEGLQVFKKFMDKIQLGGSLDFLFACKGIMEISDPTKLYSHAKSIHRRLIMRENIPCLSSEMSHRISRAIASKEEPQNLRQLFMETYYESFNYMRDNYFRIFLLSPEYLEFIREADSTHSCLKPGTSQPFVNRSMSADRVDQWAPKRFNPRTMAVENPQDFADALSQRLESVNTHVDDRSLLNSMAYPDDILDKHISRIWRENSIKETSIPLNIQPTSCFAQRLNQTARSMNRSTENFSFSLVAPTGSLVVGYQFSDDQFPYRTVINETRINLGTFKSIVGRKGRFRYFFKTTCFEFDSSAAFVEVFNDVDVVPLWEGKVFAKIFPVNPEY